MMKESTLRGKRVRMVEADRGGEVHFGAQRLKEVGPAGDARYSAGVQETGFPDVLCKAMKATLW